MANQYFVQQIETMFGTRWAIMRKSGTEFNVYSSERAAWATIDEFHMTLTPEAKQSRGS